MTCRSAISLIAILLACPALGQDQVRHDSGENLALKRAVNLQRIDAAVRKVTGDKAWIWLDTLSANPRLGVVMRHLGWGGAPFIMVRPISQARTAQLPGVGSCTLLGAVELLVDARMRGGNKSCEAGAYLVGMPVNQDKPQGILVAVEHSAKGEFVFREALRFTAEPMPAAAISPDWPAIQAAFPDRRTVSDANPAWCVTVMLRPAGGSIRFRLDLGITMV